MSPLERGRRGGVGSVGLYHETMLLPCILTLICSSDGLLRVSWSLVTAILMSRGWSTHTLTRSGCWVWHTACQSVRRLCRVSGPLGQDQQFLAVYTATCIVTPSLGVKNYAPTGAAHCNLPWGAMKLLAVSTATCIITPSLGVKIYAPWGLHIAISPGGLCVIIVSNGQLLAEVKGTI